MTSLRQYLYVIWAIGVFSILPLQLMIVTLFQEFRADLNGADFYAFEEDQKKNGGSMWPHIHQQYVSIPQNEGS